MKSTIIRVLIGINADRAWIANSHFNRRLLDLAQYAGDLKLIDLL
jgi:hypothetical protein